jgi:hypothetical protein
VSPASAAAGDAAWLQRCHTTLDPIFPPPTLRPPPTPAATQPLGMPAAAMSAQQVRALLNGSASTDPEVQEQLNGAFATMSRAQLYDIMKEMKGLIAQVGCG